MPSNQRTSLYPCHLEAGAKIVDFGGWDMPLHYGSQVEEHLTVRRACGIFDVSHMAVVDVMGIGATAFLQRLLANDVARLKQPGKALYSAMLNEEGGIIDDLIVYALDADRYRLVLNCGTREKDLAWMARQADGFDVRIEERPDLAILAIQGPEALRIMRSLCGDHDATTIAGLAAFSAVSLDDWFVARTGYTGEDGVEIMLPASAAPTLWRDLLNAGASPAGLGARDTLRLEAGLNLYGSDMDESVSPLEVNLGWTVAWEPASRDFIGRSALEQQRREGERWQLVGLVMTARGVLRGQMSVHVAWSEDVGEITSGTFSPTLGHSIALARVPAGQGDGVEVEMRGKRVPVQMVKPGFVRRGKKVFA